ncbi:response regulator [Luteimonas sp. M1R5S18]|uniref:Response regulator n=1 Tax=Luteimonas rhizosphaericola TaxID=3042024 RepID=A0ABT6JHU3_9GAMM|nr:response regulator [Luteimonas rhizosphaericola]MDH5830246.1 response regulator [Luteimonas rhizosphaericola]
MNPRILLVEDDPTSRAFLLAATQALPAEVDAACDMAQAIALAIVQPHSLWLFDANLPDGSGTALLQSLRTRGLRTPAVAHTASHDPDEHAALRAAGFVATLAKPLSAQAWAAALRRVLDDGGDANATAEAAAAYSIDAQPPVWNDAKALAALGGSAANVAALRGLFLDELPASRDAVAQAARRADSDALRAALHRLQASCGFVGAERLLTAATRLHAQPGSAAALDAFVDAAQATLSPP